MSPQREPAQAPFAKTERAAPAGTRGDIPCPHLHGLRRVSLCCNARVYHPRYARVATRWASDEDQVMCSGCGRLVEMHAVVNSDGERIWPVPETFVVPDSADDPPALPDLEAWPEPFPIHLPTHLKRHRFLLGHRVS